MHPDRHLALEGAYNVRDLGGYETADGRRTRWQTFLRADGMHRLTPADQDRLVDYGVRTVIDLRRTAEVEHEPNVFAASDRVSYLRHNVTGDDWQSDESDSIPGLDQAQRMARNYVRSLEQRKEPYRDALADLAEPGALPAIFHCTAGKDRTGRIAALLLGNAGVPDDVIVEDYGISARYRFQEYRDDPDRHSDVPAGIETWQEYQPFSSPPQTMRLVLQHLNDRYGGIPGYLRAIGLTEGQLEALRSALVE